MPDECQKIKKKKQHRLCVIYTEMSRIAAHSLVKMYEIFALTSLGQHLLFRMYLPMHNSFPDLKFAHHVKFEGKYVFYLFRNMVYLQHVLLCNIAT